MNPTNLSAQIKESTAAIKNQLQELRDFIEAKKTEISSVKNAPAQKPEAAERWHAEVDQAALRYKKQGDPLGFLAPVTTARGPGHQPRGLMAGNEWLTSPLELPDVSLAMLCWLMPDEMKEAGRTRINAADYDANAMPLEGREEKIKALREELAEAEKNEAELIAEAESAGLHINKRPAVIERERQAAAAQAEKEALEKEQAEREAKRQADAERPHLYGTPVPPRIRSNRSGAVGGGTAG